MVPSRKEAKTLAENVIQSAFTEMRFKARWARRNDKGKPLKGVAAHSANQYSRWLTEDIEFFRSEQLEWWAAPLNLYPQATEAMREVYLKEAIPALQRLRRMVRDDEEEAA